MREYPKQNLENKSYEKAMRVRTLVRHEMFERNRATTVLPSYLSHYDSQTRQILIDSLKEPIPDPLPPPSLFTISFYRRLGRPCYVTRLGGKEGLKDPHLTYESLWILAGLEEVEDLAEYKQIVKEFQEELPGYLASEWPEIKEMAIIAAGNRIIGKPEDIIGIVAADEKQLWVMINHIYERKILNAAYLYHFMEKGMAIAFRTIFQLTNCYKDESIDSILKDGDVLTIIVKALGSPDEEIQKYSIRILGNVLAEPDDYSRDLMKYDLLHNLEPLLSSKNPEIRQDVCWLVSNYVYDNGAAKEVLYNSKLKERLISMFQSPQVDVKVKEELYFILLHLVEFGDKQTIYKMALDDNILGQCESDLIEVQDQNLSIVVLDLIKKLINLGDEFLSGEGDMECNVNPFIRQCKESELWKLLKKKTFDQHQDISNLSSDIIDILDEERDM